MKGMDTYDTIETDKDRIDSTKLIHSVCSLQYDVKKDVMLAV